MITNTKRSTTGLKEKIQRNNRITERGLDTFRIAISPRLPFCLYQINLVDHYDTRLRDAFAARLYAHVTRSVHDIAMEHASRRHFSPTNIHITLCTGDHISATRPVFLTRATNWHDNKSTYRAAVPLDQILGGFAICQKKRPFQSELLLCFERLFSTRATDGGFFLVSPRVWFFLPLCL